MTDEIREVSNVLHNVLPRVNRFPAGLEEVESLLVTMKSESLPTLLSITDRALVEARDQLFENENEAIKILEDDFPVNQIKNMPIFSLHIISGMHSFGTRGYTDLVLLSEDYLSQDPSIQVFSNQNKLVNHDIHLSPKNFELGLTGRLFKSKDGEIVKERISIKADLYDLFSFAYTLDPMYISAVKKDGSIQVMYSNCASITGAEITLQPVKDISYVISSEEDEHNYSGVEILPPPKGYEIVKSKFPDEVRKNFGMMLVGHNYGEIKKFYSEMSVKDSFLWKLCRHIKGDDGPLIDGFRSFGKYDGGERVELKDRLMLSANKACLDLRSLDISEEGMSIMYSNAPAITSLMNDSEKIEDIWIESPVSTSETPRPWDVIYHKDLGIYFHNSVRLKSEREFDSLRIKK